MSELDRVIHEPVRLRIMAILSGVDRADFKFMLSTLGLSKGNLASHMDRLEQAGYVEIQKSFNGRMPHTEYCLTEVGKSALANYWAELDAIRANLKTSGSKLPG
jgi:DNA-binding transcriptional ArsR family regulator